MLLRVLINVVDELNETVYQELTQKGVENIPQLTFETDGINSYVKFLGKVLWRDEDRVLFDYDQDESTFDEEVNFIKQVTYDICHQFESYSETVSSIKNVFVDKNFCEN